MNAVLIMNQAKSDIRLACLFAVLLALGAYPGYGMIRSWLASRPVDAQLELTAGLAVTGIRVTLLDAQGTQRNELIVPVPMTASDAVQMEVEAKILETRNPLSSGTTVHLVQLQKDGRPISLTGSNPVSSWGLIDRLTWSPFPILVGDHTATSALKFDVSGSEVSIMTLKSRAAGKLHLRVGDAEEILDQYEPSDGTLWTFGYRPRATPLNIPFSLVIPPDATKMTLAAEPSGHMRVQSLTINGHVRRPMSELGLQHFGVSSVDIPLQLQQLAISRRALILTGLVCLLVVCSLALLSWYQRLATMFRIILISATPTLLLVALLEYGARLLEANPSPAPQLTLQESTQPITESRIMERITSRAAQDTRFARLLSDPGFLEGFMGRFNHPAYRSKRWFSEDFLISSMTQVGWYPQAGTNLILRQDSDDPFITVQDSVRLTTGWSPAFEPTEGELWVFGGSTTYCSEVPNDLTWPSILQKLLLERSIRLKVKNYGTTSIKASQELGRLAIELSKGAAPSAIIFYDGVNDVAQGVHYGNPHGTIYSSERHERELQQADWAHSLMETLRERSAAIRYIVSFLPKPSPSVLPRHLSQIEVRERLVEDTAAQWSSVITDAYKLASSNSARFMAFLQPNLYTHGRGDQPLVPQCAAGALECAFTAAYPAMQNATNELSKRGIPVFDLTAALDPLDAESTFLDFCHVVDTGNEAIAQAILQHIVKEWYTQPPPDTKRRHP